PRRQFARQRNDELGKSARPGLDVDAAAVLFHDDVIAHGEPEPGTLASRLGGEKGIEHLLPDFGRDSRAVVANADLNALAEVLCRGTERRLKTILARLIALGRGIEPVGNQIEKHPRDLLRIKLDRTGGGIEVALERDIEAGFFRPRTVIGEIEALF